ncbi:MAG: hypothetical protein RMK29_06170 [Myxococcales bacterium]|nr:hypothetical protein [Myxococcota bacterium]MDW8281277.1 hypothetical protein [Myxococcales bacterium]
MLRERGSRNSVQSCSRAWLTTAVRATPPRPTMRFAIAPDHPMRAHLAQMTRAL